MSCTTTGLTRPGGKHRGFCLRWAAEQPTPRLAGGRPPRVFEDGAQRRDFIHVADVAAANVLAITNPGRIGGAYNIASGGMCTVGQMADAVCDGYGPGAPRPIITGEYRIGDVRHVTASPALARRAFGFVAQIPHWEGLAAFATAPMRRSLRSE